VFAILFRIVFMCLFFGNNYPGGDRIPEVIPEVTRDQMPYIESKISNDGFLPYGDVIDDIDDHLAGDRFVSAKTASEESLPVFQELSIGSATPSDINPVEIATDSEAISFQSHHSSTSDLTDMFASQISTHTIRRKSESES